jgi:hypothetical protein
LIRMVGFQFIRGNARLDDNGDLIVVAVDKPIKWHC